MRKLVAVLVLGAFAACSQSLTGDMTGTGGSGTGGVATGAGNTGGMMRAMGDDGGADLTPWCNNLIAEYQAAIFAAQTCDVGQAGQCQQTVDRELSSCGACPVYVNDASKPQAIQQAWLGAGCDKLPSAPCIVELCVSTPSNMCVLVLDTSQGSCSAYNPTGTGGSSPDGGVDTCDSLSQKYAAALPAARSCTAGADGQCGTIVPAELSFCPGCAIYVNDTPELFGIRQAWIEAGCENVPSVCLAIACQPAMAATCAATDAGGATCATTYGTSL